MATLAQLQQNPLFNRQQVRNALGVNQNALNSLLLNPLHFLSNVALICSAGAGHQTVLDPLCGFSLNPAGTELKIGLNVSAVNYPNRLTIPVLLSPTRASAGPAVAHRFAAVQRFPAAGATRVWVTDQQTGCTVLALDWGLGQYSMFHLLPHDNAAFGRLARAAFCLSDTARASVKNSSLRTETTQVVNASLVGGAQPVRYVLLQSQHNASGGRYMQTIGLMRNASWEFYRQIQGVAAHGMTVQSAAVAPWRPWNEYFYHDM